MSRTSTTTGPNSMRRVSHGQAKAMEGMGGEIKRRYRVYERAL